jgi:hypothetical protein
MAEKKKESKEPKIIEFPKPEDKLIDIPTRVLEALLAAIDSGNWVSAVNVINEVRAIAEEQHPSYFKRGV